MSDPTDMNLVREFAEHNSESAFAELVRRHLNLVYSIALRFSGNVTDAEDIVQAVFVILARKAPGLRGRAVLTGWMYETTRLAALQFLRTRARRHQHEQEAHMETLLQTQPTDTAWPQIAPLLEEAMSRLSEKDRTLLALRYFENRTNEESAALLGIGDWAARKRSARALEKLRKYFSMRGVHSTTAIIAQSLSANSVQSAPAALVTSVTAIALTKGVAASASTLTLIHGALKLMASTKLKIGIASAIIVALVATTATMTAVHFSKSDRSVEFSIVNHSDLGLSNFSINSDHFALLLGAIPRGTSMRGTYHVDSRGWFYFEANGLKLDSRGKDFRNYFTFTPRQPMSFEIGPDLQVTARH